MIDDKPNFDTIFAGAIEIASGEERAAFIARACGADEELRRRVERLVDAHFQAGSFLESPPASPTASMALASSIDVSGTVIGPYKLLQPIGEGGMGTVYMAEQAHPVRRKVALKLIKAGMDSRQVIARFEAERQALALMDHPNIATVLDAGTTEHGRPYFVMELVKGVPITSYCDEHRLTPRERLELFVPVCQAVQHAHQKGIIHRDLKPSNILIAQYDGQAVPKVIDFGVAKATGQRLTDQTLYTEFGSVVGTLEYMSPEQAELNQLDIDTRSDIYSLGAILYELLTGSTPLGRERLKVGAIIEMLRLIREEESPRPSQRLSTTDELPSIAACRRIEPRKLSGLVRGELDWIVMKALEKDRSQRYETANGLARDLQRFLAGDPVEAGPPSAVYRLRKFARKHRAAFVTAAAFALLLAVGSVVSTVLMLRALSAERLASQRLNELGRANAATTKALDETRQAQVETRAEAGKAKAVNAFLTEDLLTQAEPANTAAEDHVSLLEVLDRAAAKVGDRFAGQPEVEDALRRTMAGTYHGLASWEKAESQWRAVLGSARRRLGPESPEALTALGEQAHILRHRGRIDDEVLEMFKSASEGLARVLGPDNHDTIQCRDFLASAYLDAGRTAEAIKLLEANLKVRESQFGPDDGYTLQSSTNLAATYLVAGRGAEAMKLAEAALKLSESKFGADHPQTLIRRNILAYAYLVVGRIAEAIKLGEATLKLNESKLGLSHPDTLANRHNLAVGYLAAGRTAEAITMDEATLKLSESKFGTDHPSTLRTMNNLAEAYLDANRWVEAERTARECLGLREKKQPDVWSTFNTKSVLGGALLGQKNYTGAEPLLLAGYQGMKDREAKIPVPSRMRLVVAMERLLRLYEATRNKDKANEWQQKLAEAKAGAKP